MKGDPVISRTDRLKEMLARGSLYRVVLAAFTIYGMACKFLLSLNLQLNSDLITPGFLAMEMVKNGNYLLKGIYLNALDSQLFNDVLLFHLVPQALSNYDPGVLRVTGFVIFMLVVAVFSYIVFIVTKDKTNTLVFAALMANIMPLSYSFFDAPMSHISAILFAGVFMILFLTWFDRLSCIDVKNPKGLAAVSLLLIALAILTFSNLIFAVFFIFPVAGYYLFLHGKKSYRSIIFAVMLLASGGAAVIFARFIVNRLGLACFNSIPVIPRGIEHIAFVNIPLYVNGLLLLICSNVYRGVAGFASFGVIEALTAVLFLVVLGLAVKNLLDGNAEHKRIALAFLLFSVVATFVAYVFTSLCVNIYTTRYLTFTAVLVFLLISAYFSYRNKAMAASVLLILVVFAAINFDTVKALSYHPNKGEREIIGYLGENNLTFGYSGYWDSIILTYLSGGEIVVRPVMAGDGGLKPVRLISSDEWYNEIPDRYFLLVNNARKDQVNDTRALVETVPSSAVYHYKGYTIYAFNNTTNINNKLLFKD
ncbi:MAG: hypothetical protein A4E28_02113 [Methanocella sp. PtaU1.Bin125]|nr:MAG: hypothetical protein A4E28_02113 [Methanocella sp. PtaU1.Bin125]